MSILRRFCGRKTQIFRKIWVGFLSVGKIFRMKKQFRRREIFHIYMLPYMPPDTEKVLSEFQRCRYYFNNII